MKNFIVTSTASPKNFADATQPVRAKTAIVTSEENLICADTHVPVADGDLPVYMARPATLAPGATLPVILVVQEIFGVHDYIKDICRRFAHLGYFAIAPELFARYGDPRDYPEIHSLMTELVSKIPDAEVMGDLDDCLKWAGQNGGDVSRAGITGFCWGGRAAWLFAAHHPSLKAAVAWYGRLEGGDTPITPKQPLALVDELKAPVLGLYGELDLGITQASVGRMKAALASSANPVARECRIVTYPDAGHAFHADYRPSYHQPSAEDGWKRAVKWLNQRLNAEG